MKTIYENLEVQFNKLFRHINVGSFKTRERYGKAFKRFMVFLAKEYHARKKVSKLLGHHRDEVTKIYLAAGDDDA